jgi:hypothetical protein
MARIGLVHFYTLGETFIHALNNANVNIQFASVPHFAHETVDYEALRTSNPNAFVFDIATWNIYEADHSYLSQKNECILSDRERLQLIIQSERLDHLSNVSIADRLHLLTVIINKSIHILRQYQIDALFYGGTPHSFADCTLYYVARSLGIPTYTFQDVPGFFPNSFYHNSNHACKDSHIDYTLDERVADLLSLFSREESSIFVDRNKHRSDPWKDSYTRVTTGKSSARELLINYACKDPNANLGIEYLDYWENLTIRRPIDISSGKKLLIFLHVDPECSVNPSSGLEIMTHLRFLQMVNSIVPNEWRIFVKEHPSMFMAAWQRGARGYALGRSSIFRCYIESVERFAFIPAEMNARDAVSLVDCTATIRGTASLESILARKPCLATSSSPINAVPGMIDIETLTDFDGAFMKATKELGLSNISDNDLLVSILKNTIPASANGSKNLLASVDNKESDKNQLLLAHVVRSFALR